MRRILLSLLFVIPAFAQNAHPRLILSPTMLSELRVKACIGQPGGCVTDPQYTTIKNDADVLKTWLPQALTVVSMSNSNPITVTVNEDIGAQGWCGGIGSQASMFMAGLPAGPWAALNVAGRVSLGNSTKTGTHTFTFPMDSTTWGAYPGGAVLFTNNSTCNNMLYYDYEGSGWYQWITELGLMYQLTGDSSYATNAVALLDYINTLAAAGLVAPFAIDSGFPSRFAVLGIARAFDWFYPLLSSGQKTATVNTLNTWWAFYQANLSPTSLIFAPEALPTSNYWGGHMVGWGAAGLATLGDNATASTMNTFIRGQIDTYMTQVMATPQTGWYSDTNSNTCPYFGGSGTCGGSYTGGGQAEGYNYGPNHMQRLLEYVFDVLTATNEDMYSTTAYMTPFVQAVVKNMVHLRFPNTWQAPNVGESANVIQMFLNLPVMIAYLRQGQTESGWMQFFINSMATPPTPMDSGAGGLKYQGFQGATTNLIPMDQFLWSRSITPIDYTATEPTTFASTGVDGEVSWRSDWTTAADQITFVGGPVDITGHHVRDSSAVYITRGSDYLIINGSHYAGGNGYVGSAWDTTVSDAGPMLHFDDFGAYLPGYNTQTVWGQWIAPRVKQTSTYMYGYNNFIRSWDALATNLANRTLRYYYRAVAHIGSSTLVYDRMMSKLTTYVKEMRWPISPSSSTFPIVNPNGLSRTSNVVTVTTTAANTIQAGDAIYLFGSAANASGPSFDGSFTVASVTDSTHFTYNQTAANGTGNGGMVGFAPRVSSNIVGHVVGSSKVWINPLLPASPTVVIAKNPVGFVYEAQIADSVAANVTNFMTLIYAGDSGASLPTSTMLTASSNAVAAQVADTTPVVFAHASVVTDNGNNTYTDTPQTSMTFTSTHSGTGSYLVGGLSPGTWNVTVNSNPVLTGATVGTDGTLYFTSTSGNFSLSGGAAPPTSPASAMGGKAKMGGKAVIH